MRIVWAGLSMVGMAVCQWQTGGNELPQNRGSYAFQRSKCGKKQELAETVQICYSFKELGAVEIVPITSRYSKASRNGINCWMLITILATVRCVGRRFVIWCVAKAMAMCSGMEVKGTR